jgi:hypothetical protein
MLKVNPSQEMLHHPTDRTSQLSAITDEEVASIIGERLPRWKVACDKPGADIVIIQQEAFGRSQSEILLLHCAIRYAGIAGKTVMVAPYPGLEGSSR